jgi:hypothetical protein
MRADRNEMCVANAAASSKLDVKRNLPAAMLCCNASRRSGSYKGIFARLEFGHIDVDAKRVVVEFAIPVAWVASR